MDNSSLQPVKRALISVSDKTDIIEFAGFLAELGVEILSTGGTWRHLNAAGISAMEISEYTGFPEMMGGRLKTLHPKIHGGILGRRSLEGGLDAEQMAAANIPGIDLVAVNLYPFSATIAKPDTSLADAIENIDIGGPAMLRAAAKNHASVAVLTRPADYAPVMAELKANQGALGAATRFRLAAQAFQHTAVYDGSIANYLGSIEEEQEPAVFGRYLNLSFERSCQLRYGENPHQAAALYQTAGGGGLSQAEQLQGKALSYNNINDADAAWQCVCSFTEPCCVIVKHGNPCGVSVADTLQNAYERAYDTDPSSAFGGIIAFNKTLDASLLAVIAKRQYTEVILAPKVTGDATAALTKRKNTRLLVMPNNSPSSAYMEYRTIAGGLLAQAADTEQLPAEQLRIVTQRPPTAEEHRDLLFAWRVAMFVKSNAMVVARDQRTIGIGAGQMSRVYSTRIAALKAKDEGLETHNAVLASDAFLPFRDGLDEAARIGVSALIQPGGSVRDDEVIAAADEANMAMLFTGTRHFRH